MKVMRLGSCGVQSLPDGAAFEDVAEETAAAAEAEAEDFFLGAAFLLTRLFLVVFLLRAMIALMYAC